MADIEIEVRQLNFFYEGNIHILKDVSLPVYKRMITALIGPSGCGKTTLLRCFNRMHDLYPNNRYTGEIIFRDRNILADDVDLIELRTRIGMVFQKPTPFPMSIFDNIAYGLRLRGIRRRAELSEVVERALRQAALWDEVKDDINRSALTLSGGQQQRLCIARAVAVHPEVILFDEPCSALDPSATARIEELIYELKKDYTVILVTHNMQQAARVSDYSAFLYLGEIMEYDTTERLFTAPSNRITEDYITGRFG